MPNIISLQNGIVLSNSLGSRLEIYRSPQGKYGLGTFMFNGIAAGGCNTEFLREDNHYVWDKYQADRYEIVENTQQTGTITFYGTYNGRKDKKPWHSNNIASNWLVTVTLTASSPAYRINLQVEPYLWPGRYHPLYLPVPFDNSAMECVSYPMEAPILPPYSGHWTITPDVGKVPLLLARERVGDRELHVGVGYSLDYEKQDYTKGALWYDATASGFSLRADFPYRDYAIPAQNSWDNIKYAGEQSYFAHGKPYVCDLVVSISDTQNGCVFGYKDVCGYSNDTVMRHDVMRAVDTMLNGYDTDVSNIYEKGMGYRMRAWADSDELANYYAYITFQSNTLLSYMLYQMWMREPERVWAKDRAIEMVSFAAQKQIENGAIPRCWEIETDMPHGMGDNYQETGFVYDVMTTGLCAQYTDMLCGLVEQSGDTVPEHWRGFVKRAIDYVVRIVEKENGYVRGTYNSQDIGVMNGIEAHALFALRYFYKKTGEKRYLNAMRLWEDSLYSRFEKNNDWYDGILDSNNFRPPYDMDQPRNYYTLNLLNLAGYFLDRYSDTRDETYLTRARDNFAFGWMGRMPINMPGYDMQTKGVIEEQNVWVFYDLPWPFNSSSGLARMARVTKERFYAEYYKLAIHTQLEFAHLDMAHPFCSQVLGTCTDKRAPANRFAEIVDGKHGIWLTGYSTLFIYDMLESYSYYYLAGENWGVGIDYELDFDPNFGGELFVSACSSRVRKLRISGGKITAELEGLAKPESQIIICGCRSVGSVKIDGRPVTISAAYNQGSGELTIGYCQPNGSVTIEIEDITR